MLLFELSAAVNKMKFCFFLKGVLEDDGLYIVYLDVSFVTF